MTSLLISVAIIALVVAALATMPEKPSFLVFLALLCSMPAITAMLGILGRDGTRAFGIAGTLFQLSFWMVFWFSDKESRFYGELRESLYWMKNLVSKEANWGLEMKTWFVFVGIMTLLVGVVSAWIHRRCCSPGTILSP